MENWTVCKYGKQWAIYCKQSCTYVAFGGKRDMQTRCHCLNHDY